MDLLRVLIINVTLWTNQIHEVDELLRIFARRQVDEVDGNSKVLQRMRLDLLHVDQTHDRLLQGKTCK